MILSAGIIFAPLLQLSQISKKFSIHHTISPIYMFRSVILIQNTDIIRRCCMLD